jgi:hypothetical protein
MEPILGSQTILSGALHCPLSGVLATPRRSLFLHGATLTPLWRVVCPGFRPKQTVGSVVASMTTS